MKTPIDKIQVEMYRTTHNKDANGNRVRDREKYIGYKKIKCVETGRRFCHFFIDILCIQLVFQSITFVVELILLSGKPDLLMAVTISFYMGLFGFLFYPAFYFFFEYKWQRTPGKWATGTLVVYEYGEKLEPGTAIARSLIRLVPFEAFSCFSDSNRGWHDKWSNTYVITKQEYQEIKTRLQELGAENVLS